MPQIKAPQKGTVLTAEAPCLALSRHPHHTQAWLQLVGGPGVRAHTRKQLFPIVHFKV